jgi:DNA-binding transcriptional regulator PaaX
MEMVEKAVYSRIGKFTKNDIIELCPTIGKTSVESSLKKMCHNGDIVKMGSGRATFYVRSDAL